MFCFTKMKPFILPLFLPALFPYYLPLSPQYVYPGDRRSLSQGLYHHSYPVSPSIHMKTVRTVVHVEEDVCETGLTRGSVLLALCSHLSMSQSSTFSSAVLT